MTDGRHLEKNDKLKYLHNGLPEFDEIWHGDASRPWILLHPFPCLAAPMSESKNNDHLHTYMYVNVINSIKIQRVKHCNRWCIVTKFQTLTGRNAC